MLVIHDCEYLILEFYEILVIYVTRTVIYDDFTNKYIFEYM